MKRFWDWVGTPSYVRLCKVLIIGGALLIVLAFLASSAQAKLIIGTSASETLRGTGRADIIKAKGGDDTVKAFAAADRIVAGGGADVVFAGAGKDHIDLIDNRADVVFCGDGIDTVWIDSRDFLNDCENVGGVAARGWHWR